MNNIKFWFYTKIIRFYLSNKQFDKVGFYLDKKKALANKIREEIKKDLTNKNQKMKSKICAEDVLKVADELKFNPTIKQIKEVVRIYPIYQEADPSASFNLVIEQCLYELKVEKV